MNRTRVDAIALVNWKGVFFQRYELDRQVTALEGENGAGKTSVMIAAYIVLMPDLTRLRFANVGDAATSDGDKGIFGRLGHPDAATFAAIDFRLATGERLLACVQVERRAEPNLELTPFIISGLADDVALHDVLLDRGEHDAIPTLDRINELVARAGGRLKQYPQPAPYFIELFERGVTPLRLVSDDERTKYNEMLRTSMAGGISRQLTGGLRTFLLKAETGLADTLKQMRSNLDECRRTRLQVEEAQRMEREIQEVYNAGHRMFVMAVHATRERADEGESALKKAQRALDEAEERLVALGADVEECRERWRTAHKEVTALAKELERAGEILEQIRAANAIARRIAATEQERLPIAEAVGTRKAQLRRAQDERERLRRSRDFLRDAASEALRALGDFQKGLSDLHRRAAAFEEATRRKDLVTRALPDVEIGEGNVAALRRDVEQRIAQHDAEIVRLDREISTAERRRVEHAEVLDALCELVGGSVDEFGAFATAREQLHVLREVRALAAELAQLPERITRSRRLADRQVTTRADAAKWSTDDHPISSASTAMSAFGIADALVEGLRASLATEHEGRAKAQRELAAIKKQEDELEAVVSQWRDLRARAERLGAATGVVVERRSDLEALERSMQARRDALRDQERALADDEAALRRRADDLEHRGGQFSDELLRARDAVDGELLAARYEDVAVNEAARLQAKLGPLAEAILVEDADRAARLLATFPNRPSTVLLVDDRTTASASQDDAIEQVGDAILAPSPSCLRITTIPTAPSLGRRARLELIKSLRREAAEREDELSEVTNSLRDLKAQQTEVGTLLSDSALLEQENPEFELERVREAIATLSPLEHRHGVQIHALDAQLREAVTRRAGLSALLPDAGLLDEADFGEEANRLATRLGDARAAATRLRSHASAISILEERVDVLRTIPPDENALEAMNEDMETARRQRDELTRPADALRYLERNLFALEWHDVPDLLRSQQELQPELEARARETEARWRTEERDLVAAETAYEQASKEVTDVESQLAAIDAALKRDREALTESGVPDASDSALTTAMSERERVRSRHSEADAVERKRASALDLAEYEHKQQLSKIEGLRTERDEEESRWRPVAERWQRLQVEADQAGVLRSALTPTMAAETRGQGSIRLYQSASEEAVRLAERLGKAHDGTECAGRVRDLISVAKQDFGPSYLKIWLESRDWLRRRVPPQIAEVDEPLELLARVCDHLVRLRDRLTMNERKLRGRSEDVARNIEAQRRKAKQTVLRLNADLAEVRFGSIHGVRIEVRPVAELEEVLRALRDGDAERHLFDSELPLEEALDRLFKQPTTGGATGYKLLDYREYMNLQVEVRRQGSNAWEVAHPTRMSTGEAIGVGAAIMMVVLAAWEHHANLLRARRAAGTLRLLFLDEANRLSQKSLAIMFELCQSLSLQLVIAAPEVAQAVGNTTYRLVRQLDAAGELVVHVTGRRSLAAVP